MDWAASNGDLEMVSWLYRNRKEGCTDRAMKMAKIKGHLEVIKFLESNKII